MKYYAYFLELRNVSYWVGFIFMSNSNELRTSPAEPNRFIKGVEKP